MRWCRDCYKIKRLEYRYGLGPGEYHARLEAQDHRCPICGKHADDVQRPRNHVVPLVVDHCHETGVVRGLLCWQCNSGLGHFRDDVQALKAAMEYLS